LQIDVLSIPNEPGIQILFILINAVSIKF